MASNILEVKSFFIDQARVLGQGAFGVVFEGKDKRGNVIAAKRIYTEFHPRVLNQDFETLVKLDHRNVMKILDVEKSEKTIWMMMPLCICGDLNKFYKTREVTAEKSLNVMTQIMEGINYLHSQRIVHRDIKPGNILVTSDDPLLVQLTDFDVTKCLDPEVETSLMTSNVGTLAFKAPEFFQRTSPGKIEYHRNVDIYAAGLTFLAILQAEKGKNLIPRIETPLHESEYHAPSIGQLIAERIKYKVQELNIVKMGFKGPKEWPTNPLEIEESTHVLKWLISKMTCVNPEERFSAAVVLDELVKIREVNRKTFRLIPRQEFRMSGLSAAMINDNDELVVYIRIAVAGTFYIRVLNRPTGALIREIRPQCQHDCFHCLIRHPADLNCVLESCWDCRVIRSYNLKTGKCNVVLFQFCTYRTCDGPGGTILSFGFNKLSQLQWNEQEQKLQVVKTWSTSMGFLHHVTGMCFLKYYDILICSSDDATAGMKVGDDMITIWELPGTTDNIVTGLNTVAGGPDGNVCIGDGNNNRILMIDGSTGAALTQFDLEDTGQPVYLLWSDTDPNLTVFRGNTVTNYRIVHKQ